MIGAETWRHALRARYRIGQVLRALRDRPDSTTQALARRLLTPAQLDLFNAQSPRDQYHSASTASILIEEGLDDPELLQAALLHDIGKGKQALWQRGLYVVLVATSPGLLACLSRPGVDWRGALDRSLRHALVGAELAARAGSSARVVALVARHHASPADAAEAALRTADERA